MKGVKELKARIKSVTNIQKITRAMEMVASTKLRRLQDRAMATRPFADRIEAMMRRVAAHADPSASPLLQVSDRVETEALVVVVGDKGLCGAYNANLLKHAVGHIAASREQGVATKLYLIGRKAQMFFAKVKDSDIVWAHPGVVEKVEYQDIRRAMDLLVESFVAGEVQRVHVAYTKMASMASFVPTTQDLLPVAPPDADAEGAGAGVDYILEPSPDAIMERLLPRYLEMQLYAAVLESLASEFAARRMAMKSATDAADEMLGTLGMEYNKARQEGITGELLDIVGGVMVQAG
ncbi:MAG: ATP synthase F1 subunit gamma [Planctomycetota bacterium]|nr:ATP synthase F1 subunit gamma [Planctomycetota bacterium]